MWTGPAHSGPDRYHYAITHAVLFMPNGFLFLLFFSYFLGGGVCFFNFFVREYKNELFILVSHNRLGMQMHGMIFIYVLLFIY